MQTVRYKVVALLGALPFLLLTMLGVLFWTGCAGTSTGGGGGSGGIGNALDCDNARRLYTAYLASMIVRDVSDAEIEDAKKAAAFLEVWCGWEAPKAANGRRSTVKLKDGNGVPVLVEPRTKARAGSGLMDPDFNAWGEIKSDAIQHADLNLNAGPVEFRTAEMKPGVVYEVLETNAGPLDAETYRAQFLNAGHDLRQ